MEPVNKISRYKERELAREVHSVTAQIHFDLYCFWGWVKKYFDKEIFCRRRI